MSRTGWRAWVGLGMLLLATSCQAPEGETAAQAPGEPPGQRAALTSHARQTVWVVLQQQADLAPARALRDWRARGQMVFERLRSTASLAQGPLRA